MSAEMYRNRSMSELAGMNPVAGDAPCMSEFVSQIEELEQTLNALCDKLEWNAQRLFGPAPIADSAGPAAEKAPEGQIGEVQYRLRRARNVAYRAESAAGFLNRL